jgi:putative hydrolase of the HAD superfamily
MKEVTHVFFDLDHTLWDYEANSRQTLEDLVHHFGIVNYVTPEKFIMAYEKVNEKLWHKFNTNQIDKEYIRKYRFAMVLQKLKIFIDHEPEALTEYFIDNCSIKSGLMPHTLDALNYLHGKYPMAIITNGFPEAQFPKMKASGLDKYFEQVFISDLIGLRKPDERIFHHAMERMNAKPHTSVMIGDNPKTDIRGAEGAGMKAIFYNPTGNRKSVTEWEIQSLHELVGIL